MRQSCLKCCKKHIAQAMILLDEAKVGYTAHRWLAVGHLSEAESETLRDYEWLTHIIRRYKQQVEKGKNPELLPLIELIMEELDGETIKDTNSFFKLDIDGNEIPLWRRTEDGYVRIKGEKNGILEK